MMSGLLPSLSSRTSGGVCPTCCCSVSLDRCDLLVDLEGFHLMSVARTPVVRSTLCWLSISGGEVLIPDHLPDLKRLNLMPRTVWIFDLEKMVDNAGIGKEVILLKQPALFVALDYLG